MKPSWMPSRTPRATPSVVVIAPLTNGKYHPNQGHAPSQKTTQKMTPPPLNKPKSDSTTPLMMQERFNKSGAWPATLKLHIRSLLPPPHFSYKKPAWKVIFGMRMARWRTPSTYFLARRQAGRPGWPGNKSFRSFKQDPPTFMWLE